MCCYFDIYNTHYEEYLLWSSGSGLHAVLVPELQEKALWTHEPPEQVGQAPRFCTEKLSGG